MAQLRIRHRDPKNMGTGITYVHVEKTSQLMKKHKKYKIILGVSVLFNCILLYLLLTH